jgi:hypothetical protein
MYFTITNFLTNILAVVYLGMVIHFTVNALKSYFSKEVFELPFYMKPIYEKFIEWGEQLHYSYKNKSRESYFFFMVTFVVVSNFSCILNALLPIPIIAVAFYLYVMIQLEYGEDDVPKS